MFCAQVQKLLVWLFSTGRARSSEWIGNEPLIEFQPEASFRVWKKLLLGSKVGQKKKKKKVGQIWLKFWEEEKKWGRFEASGTVQRSRDDLRASLWRMECAGPASNNTKPMDQKSQDTDNTKPGGGPEIWSHVTIGHLGIHPKHNPSIYKIIKHLFLLNTFCLRR